MRSEIVLYGLKLSLVVVLFSVSGLISTYLYFFLIEAGGEFVPGLLYTAATFLVFWHLIVGTHLFLLLSKAKRHAINN